ncbi:MAG: ATP-binding protein [Oscillospiraceae bacterium]|nr:ATP-binding protein [Oscillospiraceae bacterium]
MSDLFIGRKKELALLQEGFFSNEKFSAAVVGPNGIGKTALVAKAAQLFAENAPANTFYVNVVMPQTENYLFAIAHIMNAVARAIPERKLRQIEGADSYTVDDVVNGYSFFRNSTDEELAGSSIRVMNNCTDILAALTDLGVKLLLSIDEFDFTGAMDDTNNAAFLKWLFDISAKARSKDCSCNVLLIARSSMETLSRKFMSRYPASNFVDAYKDSRFTLRGFSEEELDEYFASYAALPCGVPCENHRQLIHQFCGRHPALLAEMRTLYAQANGAGQAVSPAQIFSNNWGGFTTTYKRLTTLLEKETLAQDGTTGLSVFYQLFIGAPYSDGFAAHCSTLNSSGLITRSDETLGADIFALADMPRPAHSDAYEPISPYYLQYFSDTIGPDKLNSLAGLLKKTELEVRGVINTVYKQLHGANWEAELAAFVNSRGTTKTEFLNNYYSLATRNNASARGLELSPVSVLAFNEYFYLIGQNWPAMQRYFSSFWYEDLQKAFREDMKDSRNADGHRNLELIDMENQKKIADLCNRILEDIALGKAGTPRTPAYFAIPDSYDPTADNGDLLIGKRVCFVTTNLDNYSGVWYGYIQRPNSTRTDLKASIRTPAANTLRRGQQYCMQVSGYYEPRTIFNLRIPQN